MKKTLSTLLTLALVIISLASCFPTVTDGTVTVVFGMEEPDIEHELEYKAEDITNGLFSVLDLLEISYEERGGMLVSVNGWAPGDENTYFWIYTSVEADFDTYTPEPSTVVYMGKTLVSSCRGAKDMSIVDGAVIYIGTIVYE